MIPLLYVGCNGSASFKQGRHFFDSQFRLYFAIIRHRICIKFKKGVYQMRYISKLFLMATLAFGLAFGSTSFVNAVDMTVMLDEQIVVYCETLNIGRSEV